jgi:MFS transporter, AAHS family, 4-hydroxybenzoate transporter
VNTITASVPKASTASRRWVLILCFLTILFDGFDTTGIGFVVPTLAREWGLAPAAFTPVFVGTSVGAVIGYVLSGHLARRFGRRVLILGSVLLFAAGSFITGWVSSVMELALLRLITGVGLGAAIPACVSLAVDSADPRRREVVTVAVTSGLALGATLAGGLGGRMIEQQGWQSLFWLGGVMPALLLPALWFVLPLEDNTPSSASKQGASASSLLSGPFRRNTLLLWGFSFCVFTGLYALTFWMPTLLLSFGFDRVSVPLGSAALGGGGFIGSLLLVPLTAWLGARRVLVCTTLAAALLIGVLSKATLAPGQVLLILGLLGGALVCGTIGQAALAVALYPAASRTAGVGFSSALGRFGSIVGPALGGALLSLDQSPRDVLINLCVPVVLGAVLIAIARIGINKEAQDA